MPSRDRNICRGALSWTSAMRLRCLWHLKFVVRPACHGTSIIGDAVTSEPVLQDCRRAGCSEIVVFRPVASGARAHPDNHAIDLAPLKRPARMAGPGFRGNQQPCLVDFEAAARLAFQAHDLELVAEQAGYRAGSACHGKMRRRIPVIGADLYCPATNPTGIRAFCRAGGSPCSRLCDVVFYLPDRSKFWPNR